VTAILFSQGYEQLAAQHNKKISSVGRREKGMKNECDSEYLEGKNSLLQTNNSDFFPELLQTVLVV
jgi:hypothetical protein